MSEQAGDLTPPGVDEVPRSGVRGFRADRLRELRVKAGADARRSVGAYRVQPPVRFSLGNGTVHAGSTCAQTDCRRA